MRYNLSKDEATLIFNGIFDYCAKTIREIDLSEKMKDLEANKEYAKCCRKLIEIICNNEIETIIFRKRSV